MTTDFFRFQSDRRRYDYLVGEVPEAPSALESYCTDQYLDLASSYVAAKEIARTNANMAKDAWRELGTQADAYRAYADNVIDTCRDHGLGSRCARTALAYYRRHMAE